MKTFNKPNLLSMIAASVMLSFMQTMAFAQDSAVKSSESHSSVTTTTTTWYAEPWAWALGAAVLIIIIIAITRSSSSSSGGTVDKVTYTKKVSREDNT